MSVQLPVSYLAILDIPVKNGGGFSYSSSSLQHHYSLSPSSSYGGGGGGVGVGSSSPISSNSFLSSSPISNSTFFHHEGNSYNSSSSSSNNTSSPRHNTTTHFKSHSLHSDFTFSTSSEDQIKINIESAVDDQHLHHNQQQHYTTTTEADNLSSNSKNSSHSYGDRDGKKSSSKSSSNSGTSSKSNTYDGEFKHLPPLDELRETFFKYLSRFDSTGKGRAMVLFLMKFMDPVSLKLKSSIDTKQVVMELIDEFCRDLLLEFEISTNNVEINGDSYYFLMSLVLHMKNRTAKLFSHDRLESFLKKQYECYSKDIFLPLLTDLNDKLIGIGILDEIQLIIQMFLHDLEDWFNIFQIDEESFINKWIKSNLDSKKLPSSALQVLIRKRDQFKHAEKEFRFSAEDLSVKFIIDSDWKAVSHLTREFSPDWYPTSVKNRGKLIQWSTKSDYSVGGSSLETKTVKMVGILENSLEECIKALHADDHLSMLKNVTFNQSESINMSNSKTKYSLANLSSDFELSLFPKRSLDMVLSSQASFVGGEVTESLLLMKSYDNGDAKDAKSRLKMIGARLLQKIDNRRTRFIDFKLIQLSGIISTSIGWDMARKKFATVSETGLKEAISRAQKKNFDISIEKHKILRTLYDNCKQYHNIDIKDVLYKL